MRHLSIKAKTILYFVGFFTILTILNQAVLWSLSSQVVLTQSEEEIKEVVRDITEDLVMTSSGPIYRDDDDVEPFIYYVDDVSFVFYQNNTITYGALPDELINQLNINVGNTQNIELGDDDYIVFDIYINETTTMRAIKNITNYDDSVRSILVIAAILSPIIIVLTGVGGYFILKHAFKPIEDVIETTNHIKTNQDYHLRIPLRSSKDELHHMTLGINEMLQATEDVLKREKQFTSNVSHELRTPLSVLRAQLEYLNEKLTQTTYQDEMIPILKQMQYLEDMVKTILMLTKLNEQKVFQVETIEVYPLLEDLFETLQEDYKEKKIQVNLEGEKDITFQGDTMLILSLLTNLMSNALKYNKENGQVTVSLNQHKDKLTIIIKDTGYGMSKEDLTHMKEPFYRSDAVRTQHELSLGVGMTIVSNIIEYYQGELKIESELNIGTTITVIL